MNKLTYGGVPVPYTVAWTGEAGMHIAPCPHAMGRPALCQSSNPGVGKPTFGKPHMDRQREVIADDLCDICAKPLKGRTKVSLSHAMPRIGAEGLCIMQVEPLLHKECARISIFHCPSLKRDIKQGTLRIRMVTKYRTQIALLHADATEEFAGVRHSGAAGHAKVELVTWQDKDLKWLGL